MSSTNDPGQSGAGESPGAGRATEAGEAPPWQCGGIRSATAPPTTAPSPTASSPSIDARVSRYITGTAAPAALTASGKRPVAEAPAERSEPARADAYPSELPDLSGPLPAAQKRDGAADRPAEQARPMTSSGGIQVGTRPRGAVRASLQIRSIDPWSALKVSSLLSVALFFVWMVAVAFLYLVLGGMGVWSKLNSNVGDLLTSTSGAGGELVSSGTIFGGAALIGLLNIVLLTAMATIGAFIYNLSTDIVGGIEVTLADRD